MFNSCMLLTKLSLFWYFDPTYVSCHPMDLQRTKSLLTHAYLRHFRYWYRYRKPCFGPDDLPSRKDCGYSASHSTVEVEKVELSPRFVGFSLRWKGEENRTGTRPQSHFPVFERQAASAERLSVCGMRRPFTL